AHVALAAARAEPPAVGGESEPVDKAFPDSVDREVAPVRGLLRGSVHGVKTLQFYARTRVAKVNVPGLHPQRQPPAVRRERHRAADGVVDGTGDLDFFLQVSAGRVEEEQVVALDNEDGFPIGRERAALETCAVLPTAFARPPVARAQADLWHIAAVEHVPA